MILLPLLLPEDLHGPKVVVTCVEVIAEDPVLGFCYERHDVCERKVVVDTGMLQVRWEGPIIKTRP